MVIGWLSGGWRYLETPADRPLDEGELLQVLQLSVQQAGLVHSHPAAGEHLPSVVLVVSGRAGGGSQHRSSLGGAVTNRFQGDPCQIRPGRRKRHTRLRSKL